MYQIFKIIWEPPLKPVIPYSDSNQYLIPVSVLFDKHHSSHSAQFLVLKRTSQMKKFLLAFEPPYFSPAAMEFARQQDLQSPVTVKGLFSSQLPMFNIWNSEDTSVGAIFNSNGDDDPIYETALQIDFFKEYCEKNDMLYSIQNDHFHYSLKELRMDTRNADILIIISSSIYEAVTNGTSGESLNRLLQCSECPLLLFPPEAPVACHTYVSMEGTREDSFALKQFTYLFPEWENKPAYLIYPSKSTPSSFIRDWQPEYFGSRYFKQVFKMDKSDLIGNRINIDHTLRNKGVLICGVSISSTSELPEYKTEDLKEWAMENRVPIFLCSC